MGSGAEWAVAVGRDGDEAGIDSGAGIVLLSRVLAEVDGGEVEGGLMSSLT